jgi:hypothetical protein
VPDGLSQTRREHGRAIVAPALRALQKLTVEKGASGLTRGSVVTALGNPIDVRRVDGDPRRKPLPRREHPRRKGHADPTRAGPARAIVAAHAAVARIELRVAARLDGPVARVGRIPRTAGVHAARAVVTGGLLAACLLAA